MTNPRLPAVTYLGGLPAAPKPIGPLPMEFGTGTVILAGLRKAALTMPTRAIASIQLAPETVEHSRAGKVALFGVAGLAAKRTTTNTVLTVRGHGTTVATFRIHDLPPADVQARLGPWLAATTVTLS